MGRTKAQKAIANRKRNAQGEYVSEAPIPGLIEINDSIDWATGEDIVVGPGIRASLEEINAWITEWHAINSAADEAVDEVLRDDTYKDLDNNEEDQQILEWKELISWTPQDDEESKKGPYLKNSRTKIWRDKKKRLEILKKYHSLYKYFEKVDKSKVIII